MNKFLAFFDKYFTVFLLWLTQKQATKIAKLEAESNILKLDVEKNFKKEEYADLKEDYSDRLLKLRKRIDDDKSGNKE